MRRELIVLRSQLREWALTAVATVFGLQLIRVLFPTLVYYLRDAEGFSPLALAPIALGVFGLAFLAWPLSRLDVPLAVMLAAGGLAMFRVLEQLSFSPASDLFMASAGIACFVIYLPLALAYSLAVGPEKVKNFGLALLLGVTLDTAIHSALLTYDLSWRVGLAPLLVIIVLALTLLGGIGKLLREEGPIEPHDLPWPAALALAGVGGWFFLQLVVFQNVARFAAVSGWPLPAAGLVVMLGNLAGLALARQLAGRGPGGIGLVVAGGLVFVAGLFFSEAAGFPAVLLPWLSQVAGFGLLMVILLKLGNVSPAVDIRRMAIGSGVGQLLLVGFSFAYYVAYDLAIGFRPAAVLPVAGVLVVLCVVGLTRKKQPVRVTEQGYGAVVVGAVLMLLPLSGWLSQVSPQPAVHGETIRVMSYNVHNGFNLEGRLDLEAIAVVIESSRVDVVGLQEVSRGWVINGSVDMAQWLSQRLDMPYVFGPTEGALWGNAILSRYPIIQAGHFPLPPETLLLRRGYITAEIETGGRPLQVTVTHLHARSDEGHVRQEQVASLVANHSDVIGLLMGDLNAEPDSVEIRPLTQAGWVDVLAGVTPPASTYTYPAGNPSRQIDYIWLRPNFVFSGATVLRTGASDHLPLIVTIGPFD